MENSEIQQQVINLGKLLVKELGLNNEVDTLGRWIAHYIAEKMVLAEHSQGKEKEDLEKECFELILKLWKHRWVLPAGKRPLEDFEPILNFLQSISPENKESYYYQSIFMKNPLKLENFDFNEDTVNYWVGIAQEIDGIARIWINYALKKAANVVKNEEVNEWLTNSVKIPNSHDAEVITVILDDINSISYKDNNEEDSMKRYHTEKIKDRIKQLEKFTKFNEVLLNAYKKELDDLLHKS